MAKYDEIIVQIKAGTEKFEKSLGGLSDAIERLYKKQSDSAERSAKRSQEAMERSAKRAADAQIAEAKRIEKEYERLYNKLDILSAKGKTGDIKSGASTAAANLKSQFAIASVPADKLAAVDAASAKLKSLDVTNKKVVTSSSALSSAWNTLGSTIRMGAVGLGVAGYAAYEGAKKFIEMATSIQVVQARIKVATKEYGDNETVLKSLRKEAVESRANFESMAGTFAKVSPSLRGVAKDSTEIISFLGTFNKGLKVSGASAMESSASMLQFAQALAKGKLDGDEFRSMNENSNYVIRKIAEGLGVTTKELFKMSEAGQLTSTVIYGALNKVKDSIDADFAAMPITVADAFDRLSTSFAINAKEADDLVGFTRILVDALRAVNSQFVDDGKVGTVTAFFYAIKEGAKGAISWIDKFYDNLDEKLHKLTGRGLFGTEFDNIKNVAQGEYDARKKSKTTGDSIESKEALKAVIESSDTFIKDVLGKVNGLNNKSAKQMFQTSLESAKEAVKDQKNLIDSLQKAWEQAKSAAKKYAEEAQASKEMSDSIRMSGGDKSENLRNRIALDEIDKSNMTDAQKAQAKLDIEEQRLNSAYYKASETESKAEEISSKLNLLKLEMLKTPGGATEDQIRKYEKLSDSAIKMYSKMSEYAEQANWADGIDKATQSAAEIEDGRGAVFESASRSFEDQAKRQLELLGTLREQLTDLTNKEYNIQLKLDTEQVNQKISEIASKVQSLVESTAKSKFGGDNEKAAKNLKLDLSSDEQNQFDFYNSIDRKALTKQFISKDTNKDTVDTVNNQKSVVYEAVKKSTENADIAAKNKIKDEEIKRLTEALKTKPVEVEVNSENAKKEIEELSKPITTENTVNSNATEVKAEIETLKAPTESTHTIHVVKDAITGDGAAGGEVLNGYAVGGWTGSGGKFEPAGIVHREEFVLTSEATRSIGLRALYYMNQYGKLPGYATGGLVGSSGGGSGLGSIGDLGTLSLNIGGNNYQMYANRSTAEELQREVRKRGGR